MLRERYDCLVKQQSGEIGAFPRTFNLTVTLGQNTVIENSIAAGGLTMTSHKVIGISQAVLPAAAGTRRRITPPRELTLTDSSEFRPTDGSLVSGDVTAESSLIVGRDLHLTIQGLSPADLDVLTKHVLETLRSAASTAIAGGPGDTTVLVADGEPQVVISREQGAALISRTAGSVEAYLARLVMHQDFGPWDTRYVPLAGTATRLVTPEAWSDYVPVELRALLHRGDGPEQRIERVPISDIAAAVKDYHQFVLLGEPGAGKTTVLRKVALGAARARLRDESAPVPLFVHLGAYRGTESPFDFLARQWRARIGTDFGLALQEGSVFLLLDGLNEMGRTGYLERLAAWRNFAREWEGTRIIFTCRTLDYSLSLPLQQVEISRLDDERVRDFLIRYVPDQAELLWEGLTRGRGDLLDLVRNPFLLALLTWIYASADDKRLPPNRGQLLGSLVARLLEREQLRTHPAVEVISSLDTILEQTITFFVQADFQTQPIERGLGEVVIATAKWVSHSRHGDILVKVFEGDLNAPQLRGIEQRIKATNTSSAIAYVVYDGELSDDAYWQMGTYKLEGLTIVPLKADVISETIVSREVSCYDKLKLLEREYLGSFNRYEMSSAILDPTWFFGRRQEADEIIDRLRSYQHAGIFGMRKIGKTSLLHHLRQRLSRESIPIAYLGLQGTPINPTQLFADIIQQIRLFIQALSTVALPDCKLLSGPTDRAAGRMFKEDILALWQVVEGELKAPFMALMMDEVERIIPSPKEGLASYQKFDEFFAPIRDISQTERCLVSVVTAIRPTIREEFDRKLPPNAMFELYDERYLSFFTYEECSNMVVKIGKWMGIEYSVDSLRRIFEETAGHPYIARLVCACIADESRSGRVSVEDVEGAIDPSLDKLNGYFKGWWESLAEEEKQLVDSVLAKQVLPARMSERQKDALRHMREQDLVRQAQDGQWDITIRLLRKWLGRRKGV
ncbi:MAG: NACHT domain-containing protein [Chloroflexota bacterium]|nr:NACHT domain-containing protein [Chloroflexota bacterium]